MPWAAVAGVAISAASSLYGAGQSKKASSAASRVSKYNAALEEAQTQQDYLESGEQQRRQIWANRQFRGEQKGVMAGTGTVMGTGSMLDAEAETAMLQELQIQDVARSRELNRKAGYARAQSIRAGGAASARQYSAMGTQSLLQGAGAIASFAADRYAGRTK
jgi:hypothetical protein